MLSTIGRLVWVPIAFLISGLAASFLLVTLGLERVTQAVRGPLQGRDLEVDTIRTLLEMLGDVQMLATGLSIVPALAVVLVGEIGRIRSVLFYIIGGGLALALVPVVVRVGTGSDTGMDVLPPMAVWQVLATAGFLGGFVYWLLAGRRA